MCSRSLFLLKGNPSNQLAVLASYAGDDFSSAYQYYRALCVKQEFPTARANLSMTYKKVLAPDSSRVKRSSRSSSVTGISAADEFATEFVTLHAMIFLRRPQQVREVQSSKTVALFASALATRALPSEMIVKVVCTTLAAWWDNRMSGRARALLLVQHLV